MFRVPPRHPTVPTRSRRVVEPGWPGEKCPPGSRVRFRLRNHAWAAGKVVELRMHQAVVAAGPDGRWRVPYGSIQVVERVGSTWTLAEIADHGRRTLQRFPQLSRAWRLVFDLAPVRAGQCRFREREIHLAVGHCLKADRDTIHDTLLHEIAHAIAGPGHNHDAHWRAIARSIGCTAERCTEVRHAGPRWIGRCNCAVPYRRQRLGRRVRLARCRRCGRQIEWHLDHDGHSVD